MEGLTSKISLLALGDVFSLNTLMATGIFTFSPSGIQMPWTKRGGYEQEEGQPDASNLQQSRGSFVPLGQPHYLATTSLVSLRLHSPSPCSTLYNCYTEYHHPPLLATFPNGTLGHTQHILWDHPPRTLAPSLTL